MTSKKKLEIHQPNLQVIWILVVMIRKDTWTWTVIWMTHKLHAKIHSLWIHFLFDSWPSCWQESYWIHGIGEFHFYGWPSLATKGRWRDESCEEGLPCDNTKDERKLRGFCLVLRATLKLLLWLNTRKNWQIRNMKLRFWRETVYSNQRMSR